MKYYTLKNEAKTFEKEDSTIIQLFIGEYEPYYYVDDSNEKLANTSIKGLKSIKKTECLVEKRIAKILKDGIRGSIDVKRILAWKLGNINMEETKSNLENGNDVFLYNTGWKNDDKSSIEKEVSRPRYTKTIIHLGELCEYVHEKSKEFPEKYGNYFDKEFDEEKIIRIVADFFDEINERKKSKGTNVFQGIGTVYSLALLYFISQGRVPIYDKFVHIALKALYFEKKPTEHIFYGSPADKKTDTVIALMREYMWLIKNTVGHERLLRKSIKGKSDNIADIRKADRALWVYGHLFKN